MFIVREMLGVQQFDPEVISHSEDFETARLAFVEWLADSAASNEYTDAALDEFDKIDVSFDSTFDCANGGALVDRYEWLCAATATVYMAA